MFQVLLTVTKCSLSNYLRTYWLAEFHKTSHWKLSHGEQTGSLRCNDILAHAYLGLHVQTNALTDFIVQWLEEPSQNAVLLLVVVENERKQQQRHLCSGRRKLKGLLSHYMTPVLHLFNHNDGNEVAAVKH